MNRIDNSEDIKELEEFTLYCEMNEEDWKLREYLKSITFERVVLLEKQGDDKKTIIRNNLNE